MTEANPSYRIAWFWLRILLNLVVCGGILAGAVGAIVWINRTEPVAQKINTKRKSAALVETLTVRRGTHSPKIGVLGAVRAAEQLRLRPQVSGRVIEVSPEFVPGGMVKKGELLLRLDPADFENTVSIRQSELRQSEASMEIEEARQRLARNELKLLQGSVDETNRALVLREPQIASMKAEVSAAKAAVERAELDLQRTSIYAPFDAQILSRSVNVGSQIGPGDELGLLAGMGEYWVLASVPVRSLRWIQFPEEVAGHPHGEQQSSGETSDSECESESMSTGSNVVLRNPDGWGVDVQREAKVAKLIGRLDLQSRLARVLVTVPDPLGQASGLPPLIIDSLLQTEIEGRPIEGVVPLKRDFVRDNDTVWVMKEGKLEIRKTDIVFRDAEYAYIRSGLEDGDEVVITTLATVAEGVGLKKIESEGKSKEGEQNGELGESEAESETQAKAKEKRVSAGVSTSQEPEAEKAAAGASKSQGSE